jgi:hypothetical protein
MRQWWPKLRSRPCEHHGPGVEETPDTGRISLVRNMGTPSRFGGIRPTTDRPTVREAEFRGGNRTAKKRMAAAERQQESEGG